MWRWLRLPWSIQFQTTFSLMMSVSRNSCGSFFFISFHIFVYSMCFYRNIVVSVSLNIHIFNINSIFTNLDRASLISASINFIFFSSTCLRKYVERFALRLFIFIYHLFLIIFIQSKHQRTTKFVCILLLFTVLRLKSK